MSALRKARPGKATPKPLVLPCSVFPIYFGKIKGYLPFAYISIYADGVQKGGLSVSKMVLNCAFLNIFRRKSLRLLFIRFYGLQEGFLRKIGLIMHGTPFPVAVPLP